MSAMPDLSEALRLVSETTCPICDTPTASSEAHHDHLLGHDRDDLIALTRATADALAGLIGAIEKRLSA